MIEDYQFYSYTLKGFEALIPFLDYLKKQNITSFIDVGSNHGVLTTIIADYFNVELAHGIDLDANRVEFCKINFGDKINFICSDFLDLQDFEEKVDLITCFGVLEHNLNWDAFINKMKAHLNPNSYLLIGVPNLGSWLNRVSLLLGYQPRDLEISENKLYGTMFGYNITGHIKGATLRGIVDFLKGNGFEIVKVKPVVSKETKWANVVDKLLSPFAGLSRRLLILAKYTE